MANKRKMFEDTLNVTSLAIAELDVHDVDDLLTIVALLDCCEETAKELTKKKRRKEWVKPWRRNRFERGSFVFLTKELSSDSASFFNYMRMNEETFNFILAAIKDDLKRQTTIMREPIPPEEKLAATLRYLATGETYISTNYQTRLSQPFLSGAIPEVCEAVWKHFKDKYIKFPSSIKEWEGIADNFTMKWQFPNCLGALDGKHITFQAKKKDVSFFYNYKGTHSIILLALVDADCRFTFIDVGCNGRSHDAGGLQQSKLKAVIDQSEKFFPPDKIIGNGRKLPFVIVGDDAFPLMKQIMKPYVYNTSVKERKIFNIRLSRARHVVEHAFGILSNRFRIFQHKINLPVEKVELITKTCCLLHNMLSEKCSTYLTLPASDLNVETDTQATRTSQNLGGAAQNIRQGFEEFFNQEGKLNWQDSML